MRIEENDANAKRKSISVFNTVERLNKHPSVFINYLRVLASAKGMTFTIHYPPQEEEDAAPRRKKTKAEQKVSNILEAKDLAHDEYEEISKRKKMGKSTTEENLQAEKHYWQTFFLTNDLDGKARNNFIYGTNPSYNYLGLIDTRNHKAEDNLKSERQLERIGIVKAVLDRLGWGSARDEDAIRKEDLRTNFVENVVDDPSSNDRSVSTSSSTCTSATTSTRT